MTTTGRLGVGLGLAVGVGVRVAVGRGVGNAVVRNRVKRRLRALASDSSVAEGWDLVVIARKPAAESPSHILGESLSDLLSRAGVMRRRQSKA